MIRVKYTFKTIRDHDLNIISFLIFFYFGQLLKGLTKSFPKSYFKMVYH